MKYMLVLFSCLLVVAVALADEAHNPQPGALGPGVDISSIEEDIQFLNQTVQVWIRLVQLQNMIQQSPCIVHVHVRSTELDESIRLFLGITIVLLIVLISIALALTVRSMSVRQTAIKHLIYTVKLTGDRYNRYMAGQRFVLLFHCFEVLLVSTLIFLAMMFSVRHLYLK